MEEEESAEEGAAEEGLPEAGGAGVGVGGRAGRGELLTVTLVLAVAVGGFDSDAAAAATQRIDGHGARGERRKRRAKIISLPLAGGRKGTARPSPGHQQTDEEQLSH